jgi:hypothetical protein
MMGYLDLQRDWPNPKADAAKLVAIMQGAGLREQAGVFSAQDNNMAPPAKRGKKVSFSLPDGFDIISSPLVSAP